MKKSEICHFQIKRAVESRIDKLNAVYTDELIKDTSLTRETITRWLKANGFSKTAGCTSRRWVKSE